MVVKLISKLKTKTKAFSNKKKMRNFFSRQLELYEMLKKVVLVKEKWFQMEAQKWKKIKNT